MRLIDADKLIRETISDPLHVPYITKRDVENAPTVYAKPAKRGKWIDKKVVDDIKLPQMQEAKCSVCGRYLSTPYVYYWTTYNYCPHCGVEMGVEG